MLATNKLLLLIFFQILHRTFAKFKVPTVNFVAYSPNGFKASIPAIDGLELFAFHANLNKRIARMEEGEYSIDTKTPDNGQLSYYNPDLQLKPGDEINYWVYVQHKRLGYLEFDKKWVVPSKLERDCQKSRTEVSGQQSVCQGNLIFSDDFSQIDEGKWKQQQYIPQAPNYEFVSYQKSSDVTFVKNNILLVKPKPAGGLIDVARNLDLSNGCTRPSQSECLYEHGGGGFIAPPVTSGQVVSNFRFKYGKIEVRAKLPAGDWIYPQVFLRQTSNPNNTIVLAYARGNEKLRNANGDDIGGSILFAGLVNVPKSKRNSVPYTNEFHAYSLTWSEDEIEVFVDGVSYGTVSSPEFGQNTFEIVLGVGVGGLKEFPDGYTSKAVAKPWRNGEKNQSKKFFLAKEKWLNTWQEDNAALQIDYVKVWAL